MWKSNVYSLSILYYESHTLLGIGEIMPRIDIILTSRI